MSGWLLNKERVAADIICIHTDRSLKHTFQVDTGNCHRGHLPTAGSYCGLLGRVEFSCNLGKSLPVLFALRTMT